MKLSTREMRAYMKSADWGMLSESDQSKGLPAPPVFKAPESGAEIVTLPPKDSCARKGLDLLEIVDRRRSVRKYAKESLSLSELSYLLYVQHGYQKMRPGQEAFAALRTAPGGGCRHAVETYLAVFDVEGLKPGLYHFLPFEHALELMREMPEQALRDEVSKSCRNQVFTGKGNICLFWSADIYRAEWRYPNQGYKIVLNDVGHICQNLYLAAEEVGCGVCAIGAYEQEMSDRLFQLDGEDEFIIYIASLGKV